ncbi:hypothetical protein FOZ63_025634 [Perkinsus olseni]|uniref:Uncharacterized protein n=1 Tax=Perkinsus olseni TaxID=32597 RepID=A0A7J6UCE4_PEROL|nr:hypothetical protein FOZ63_025634 [Perkinsus olseni]
MVLKTFSYLVITGVVEAQLFREHPFKYYCHFDATLQSVCFRSVEKHGIWGISSHKVFAYEDHPRVPQYESLNWRPHARLGSITVHPRGEWNALEIGEFPWPVDYPVKYEKVDGKDGRPGYFDVNFTSFESPRRFTRLVPVSIDEVPLRGPPPQATFEAHYPTNWTATLEEKPGGRTFKIKAIGRYSVYDFKKVKTLHGGLVKGFKANVAGRKRTAEAFFFKLPTNETQYGLMLTSGVFSYMLYRTDEVELREHDILPPAMMRPRPSNSAGLPRYDSLTTGLPSGV